MKNSTRLDLELQALIDEQKQARRLFWFGVVGVVGIFVSIAAGIVGNILLPFLGGHLAWFVIPFVVITGVGFLAADHPVSYYNSLIRGKRAAYNEALEAEANEFIENFPTPGKN